MQNIGDDGAVHPGQKGTQPQGRRRAEPGRSWLERRRDSWGAKPSDYKHGAPGSSPVKEPAPVRTSRCAKPSDDRHDAPGSSPVNEPAPVRTSRCRRAQ